MKEISTEGSPQIYGCDASPGMLEKAKQKEAYSHLECMYLGDVEKFKTNYPDLVDRFDFVIASGVLGRWHALPEVLYEMNVALKNGGILIFTTQQACLDELNYQEIIDEFVKNGEWELVDKYDYLKFPLADEAAIGDWKPTPSIMFTYKKLYRYY